MNDNRMIVDAHVHLGHGREKRLSADQLLAEMDQHGVARAVICPMDEEIILRNRAGNDRILAAVQAHPDRFVGFAVANPWYGQEAIEELRRAVGEGLRGRRGARVQRCRGAPKERCSSAPVLLRSLAQKSWPAASPTRRSSWAMAVPPTTGTMWPP